MRAFTIQFSVSLNFQVATEYKVPIFGAERDEWEYLASWVKSNNLLTRNNRYIIQLPRIVEIRNSGMYKCASLQEQLENIFTPLWEASVHPKAHPNLDELLGHISALNIISDEV